MINRSVSKPPSCDATNVMFAAEDVYLCKVYEDIVILDLKSDRYLCVMDAGAWLQPEPDGCLFMTGDVSSEDLIAAEIAARQPSTGRRRVALAPKLELPASPEISPIERLWAALQIIDATRVFQRKTLGQLVAAALKPPVLSGRRKTAAEVVGAYRDVISWIPGEGESVAPGTYQAFPLEASPEPLWSPAMFVSCPEDSGLDPETAATRLRNAVDEAVSGLARLPTALASEISGGLDSGIVASSLMHSQSGDVRLWLNAHGDTPESDERPFVAALADRLGISPVSVPLASAPVTEETLMRISRDWRPGINGLDVHHDLDWVRRVKDAGATAIMTGKGGDSIGPGRGSHGKLRG